MVFLTIYFNKFSGTLSSKVFSHTSHVFQQSFIAIDASLIPGCSLSTFASKSSLQSGTTDWGTLFLWFLGRAFDGWMSHLNRMLNSRMLNSYLATDACTLLFNRFLFVLEGGAGNQHASTPKPNGWIKLLGSFTAKYTFFLCVRKVCFTTTFGLKRWFCFHGVCWQ